MAIKYTTTLKLNINNISIEENQLIHCINNDESFFDVSSTKRIGTGPLYYLNKEADKSNLIAPIENGLYFVIESKFLYKYTTVGWVQETNNFEALFNSNVDNNLYPAVLTRNGRKLAPFTFIDCVLNKDGKSMEDIIGEITNNDSDETDTDVVATTDGQTTFTIPYPFFPYDLTKNIMIIVYKNEVLDPDSYTLSSDLKKVVLSMGIPKGDHITFKFLYSKGDSNSNATTINNIGIYLTRPTNPKIFDIVIDIFKRKIEAWTGTEWVDIGSAHSLILKSGSTLLSSKTSTISINIDGFDKSQDNLIVFKNTTYLAQSTETFTGDYTISSDSKNIVKTAGTWDGSSSAPILFVMLCFKNVPTINGKFNGTDIVPGTISEDAFTQAVINKLNKQTVTIDVLNQSIANIKGNPPDTLNTIEKLANAVNKDPNYNTNIDTKLQTIQETLNNIADLMANKLTISVVTIDNKSVNGQIVKIKNTDSGDYNEYILVNNNNSITVNLTKATSYEISVNTKNGYLTPAPITIYSGHLGDNTNANLMYHL